MERARQQVIDFLKSNDEISISDDEIYDLLFYCIERGGSGIEELKLAVGLSQRSPVE